MHNIIMSTILFEFISAMSGMSGLGQEQKLQQHTQGRDGGGHGRGAGKRGQNEEQVLGKGRQLLAGAHLLVGCMLRSSRLRRRLRAAWGGLA